MMNILETKVLFELNKEGKVTIEVSGNKTAVKSGLLTIIERMAELDGSTASCDICLRTPCHNRCPNAPEPPVVHACLKCDAEIYAGDGYYDIDGEIWCEECVTGCHATAEMDEKESC